MNLGNMIAMFNCSQFYFNYQGENLSAVCRFKVYTFIYFTSILLELYCPTQVSVHQLNGQLKHLFLDLFAD